jgi:hypothetical protein
MNDFTDIFIILAYENLVINELITKKKKEEIVFVLYCSPGITITKTNNKCSVQGKIF